MRHLDQFSKLATTLSNDTSIKILQTYLKCAKMHYIEFFVFMFFLLLIKIKKMKNRPVVRKCVRWKRYT